MTGLPHQVFTVERHRALVRPVHAGDEVEDGRFAGAVGPDDAPRIVFVNIQVESREGRKPAECVRKFVDGKYSTGVVIHRCLPGG